MQFEEFNKKIREAAEQHHPAYDEKAWKKMEKLLSKHLPQEKKDRKRIIFFILFFLLLGGGVFVTINKPWQKNTTAVNQPTITFPLDNKQLSNSQQTNDQKTTPGTVTSKEEDQSQQPTISNTSHQNNLVAFEMNPRRKKIIDESLIAKQNRPVADIGKEFLNNEVKKDENTISNNQLPNKNNEVSTAIANVPNNVVTVVTPKIDESKQETVQEDKNGKDNNTKATAKKNKTGSKKFLDGFAFNLSGGPDVSKAGDSRFGKTTFAFGAGISYTWKKFTLRTGVYSANKIYTADENDYKLNYSLPQNIIFEGADANCKVVEIPFSLTYNFASKKGGNWFAGTGLSSYLMKEEDYTFWYTNSSSGSYYPKHLEIKNKNKHYFSVINLSAGYTRQVSNSISITAEPYVKIPFQGIGLGRVQLNSGGVLFTVGIQPFNNKNKK